jgi:uncharacterized caspase-like protein
LHEAVSESACKEVVLLLDCCYSGAVEQGLKGDDVVNSQLRAIQTAGFFTLTASTSIQSASETETDHHGRVMGRFTAAIVDGIQSGGADLYQKGEIRLTDLKAHIERTIRGQTPQFFAHAGSGDPLVSYNPRAVPHAAHPDGLAQPNLSNISDVEKKELETFRVEKIKELETFRVEKKKKDDRDARHGLLIIGLILLFVLAYFFTPLGTLGFVGSTTALSEFITSHVPHTNSHAPH